MMKFSLITFISILFFFACTSDSGTAITNDKNVSPKEAEKPNIVLEVSNVPSGIVYLIGTNEGVNFKMDSTQVNGTGPFKFQNETSYPAGFYYVYFSNGNNLPVLLDTDQTMTIKADGADLVGTAQVEGNLETELLYNNLKYENDHNQKSRPLVEQKKTVAANSPEEKAITKQIEQLGAERAAYLEEIFKQYPKTLFTSYKKAGKNPPIVDVRNPDGSENTAKKVFLFRQAFWDDVDFNDERLIRTPVISNKIKRYVEQLTPQNADSIVASASFLMNKVIDKPAYLKYFANFITLKYKPGKSTIMDAEKIHVHMVRNYFTKELAFWSDSMNIYGLQRQANEMAASLTGLKAPDVKAENPNGEFKSIYESKSNYIIVYLYNPTCEHCMVETPKLSQLFKTTSRQDLDVFAIAIDTNDQEWRDYIKKNNLTWTNVYDPSNRAIYAKYYVDITPEIYVLNKDRIIIAKNLKVDQIQEVINRDKGL